MTQDYRQFLLVICMYFVSFPLYAQFESISPVPGSRYHNPEETIILCSQYPLDESSIHVRNLFSITGSATGVHRFEVKLVGDLRTIILKPVTPFAEGESVNVKIGEGIETSKGEKIEGHSFGFSIRDIRSEEDNKRIASQMEELYESEFGNNGTDYIRDMAGEPSFPEFTINKNNNPAAGKIFFHNFTFVNNNDSHYCIIKNNGDSVFGKFDTVRFWGFDVNHNGYLTLNDRHDTSWVMLDSNYQVIATYKMGNGYVVDAHEFQIFPDGHRYMMAYDPQIVDMTVYDPGYQSNATVIGLVIQELDEADNVLFQWRSWDHFEITDCDHVNLAFSIIDAVHGNSIEVLTDGNILISSRHLSEITKINRATGNIIWRMGGKNNQFTFIDDPDGFSFQHDARKLSNGNITLFDNGNYHVPARSWAKEYQVDEVNKTATLVWSFSRTVDGNNLYANALGSVQRLSGGNTFICWGNINGNGFPNITEVNANKDIVWELELAGSDQAIYRSRKHGWQPCARPSESEIYVSNITPTTAKIHWNAATNASSYEVQYHKAGNITWKSKTTSALYKKLKNLTPNKTYEYKINAKCTDVSEPVSAWTSIMTFTTDPLKEILNEPAISKFNLYPNPASDHLQIDITLDQAQLIAVTFYDITGKRLFHQQQNLNAGKQLLTFEITTFPPGIYAAELISETGRNIRKFVKE